MNVELEYVPSVRELEKMNEGYAIATEWNKDKEATRWQLTQLGYDYLGAIMRRNAEKLRAAGVGDWKEPPTRQIGGLIDVS